MADPRRWTEQPGHGRDAWAPSRQQPFPGPPNAGWAPRSGALPSQEYGHANKRARIDPHAIIDQAQLYAAQTGRQSAGRHGGRQGSSKHTGGSGGGGGGAIRHRKHHRGPKAQPQVELQSLPDASNYLDSYPATKDLMRQFKDRGVEQSPLAVVNEYAARMMQQVMFDMRQESLSGGFWVEARLVGKRSPQPVEAAAGRARNKQIGKQVAAAALLERLLDTAVDPESLLNPNAGEKAPKKWQPPQKPGLGVDPAALKFGGGPPFRRYGVPRFVRGGTIVPVAGGLEYLPGSELAQGLPVPQRQQWKQQQGEAGGREPLHRAYERERELAVRRHAEEQRRRLQSSYDPYYDLDFERGREAGGLGREGSGPERGRQAGGPGREGWGPERGKEAGDLGREGWAPERRREADSTERGHQHYSSHHSPHHENCSYHHDSHRHSHRRHRSSSSSSKGCGREGSPPDSNGATQLDWRWERMLRGGGSGNAGGAVPAAAATGRREGGSNGSRAQAEPQERQHHPEPKPPGGSTGADADSAGGRDRWEMYGSDMAAGPSLAAQLPPWGPQHGTEQWYGAGLGQHAGLRSGQQQQQQLGNSGASDLAEGAGLHERNWQHPADYGASNGGGSARRILCSTLSISTGGSGQGGGPGQRVPHTTLSVTIPNS